MIAVMLSQQYIPVYINVLFAICFQLMLLEINEAHRKDVKRILVHSNLEYIVVKKIIE